MSKSSNRYQLLDDLDFSNSISVESSEDLKFNLFLRAREVGQIVSYLEKLMLKKKSERDLFVSENRNTIESLMKVFVQDSNLSIEGMQLDSEAAALSVQMAMDLRKSISLINALFYGVDGLKS